MNGEQIFSGIHPSTEFAKSSGTTSDKSKFIPNPEDESLEDCHFKAAKDVLAMY